MIFFSGQPMILKITTVEEPLSVRSNAPTRFVFPPISFYTHIHTSFKS